MWTIGSNIGLVYNGTNTPSLEAKQAKLLPVRIDGRRTRRDKYTHLYQRRKLLKPLQETMRVPNDLIETVENEEHRRTQDGDVQSFLRDLREHARSA